jgi:hypothetical protein
VYRQPAVEAVRIRAGRMAAIGLASILGIVAAGAIVAALMGAAVPGEYLATFGARTAPL